MANNIGNIEKFFQDLFSNFRVKPNRDSWDRIVDALDNTNPKDALIPNIDEVGTLFKGFKVKPSERVWQNIHKILERDQLPLRRFSRSAASAIIAFFSHTAVTVITSVAVLGGLGLLLFNPFNNDSSKLASVDNRIQNTGTIKNQEVTISKQLTPQGNRKSIQSTKPYQQSTNNNTAAYTQTIKNQITATNTPEHKPVVNNNEPIRVKSINNQSIIPSKSETQNPVTPVISTQTNSEVTNQPIPDQKPVISENNLLVKYPSIKLGIRQNRYKSDKPYSLNFGLHKKALATVDFLYNKYAKKPSKRRDMFSVEAYYMPLYGSTTYIAHQTNSATLERSFNEYLSGNPNSCLGINFAFNPNRFSVETGIMYQDRYTRRNDDLKWISYETVVTKDSVGFVFNTIDSTYQTIYDYDTNIKKNELLKNYRTRMSYHTVEVPLMIGYKLMYKKNTLTVRTGVLASFITESSEQITNIDETARPYIIYPDKNKVEFSYVLNLSYDFNVSDNFKVSLTPTFRYNINGLYKGYSINSRPTTLGLGLGVKYVF